MKWNAAWMRCRTATWQGYLALAPEMEHARIPLSPRTEGHMRLRITVVLVAMIVTAQAGGAQQPTPKEKAPQTKEAQKTERTTKTDSKDAGSTREKATGDKAADKAAREQADMDRHNEKFTKEALKNDRERPDSYKESREYKNADAKTREQVDRAVGAQRELKGRA